MQGHGDDDHRRRHHDERSRSRSRSRPRITRPTTKSKRAEEPRSTRRTTDDRHYEKSTSPESSRRQKFTEAPYRDPNPRRRHRSPRATDPFYEEMKENELDTDTRGRKYVIGDLNLKNLMTLPGKPPETGEGSMRGHKRHEIPVAVDCLEVKPKPRRQDSSGDKKRIMLAPIESTRTLVHRPVSRRDSVPSRADSPEHTKSSRRGDRPYREAETHQRGAYLPDDTQPSQADYIHGSRKKYRERRSPSPPISSPQYSSRQSRHRIPETGLETYHPPAPPGLYREAHSMEVPSYPPTSARAGFSSARCHADLSQPLPHYDPQPSSPVYSRTSVAYGSQGGSGHAYPPNYTGTCYIDGSEFLFGNPTIADAQSRIM